MMRCTLSKVLNIQLNNSAWQQASLPIKAGGLGVRSAVQLSASAFLASTHGAEPLVARMFQGLLAFARPSSRSSLPVLEQVSGC